MIGLATSIGIENPTPCAFCVDRGVDADDLARAVHERAAGVAGVDGRIGLDQVVQLLAARLRASEARIWRPRPETTPVVTVFS